MTCPYGFHIIGPIYGTRHLVDFECAMSGFAQRTDRLNYDAEHFISAFAFGSDFAAHLRANRTSALFNGDCHVPWVWWDIDRENQLDEALKDVRALSLYLSDTAGVSEKHLLHFFSGRKGFHVGCPGGLFSAELIGKHVNRLARASATFIATEAGGDIPITIDIGIYDKVRPFRAPNSVHPTTRRYKRFLHQHELLALSLEAILELSKSQAAFDIPTGTSVNPALSQVWERAKADLNASAIAHAATVKGGNADVGLNQLTLQIIRGEYQVPEGSRHRLFYSAARNLAECGAPLLLINELLRAPALDSGLTLRDAQRQFQCGFNGSFSGEMI